MKRNKSRREGQEEYGGGGGERGGDLGGGREREGKNSNRESPLWSGGESRGRWGPKVRRALVGGEVWEGGACDGVCVRHSDPRSKEGKILVSNVCRRAEEGVVGGDASMVGVLTHLDGDSS